MKLINLVAEKAFLSSGLAFRENKLSLLIQKKQSDCSKLLWWLEKLSHLKVIFTFEFNDSISLLIFEFLTHLGSSFKAFGKIHITFWLIAINVSYCSLHRSETALFKDGQRYFWNCFILFDSIIANNKQTRHCGSWSCSWIDSQPKMLLQKINFFYLSILE